MAQGPLALSDEPRLFPAGRTPPGEAENRQMNRPRATDRVTPQAREHRRRTGT